MTRNSRIVFERILCPTDLTEESDGGLGFAIALAEAYSAKLFVLHCLEAQALPAYAYHGNVKRQMERSILRQFSETPTLNWEAVVVDGDPVTAIPQEAASRAADLIVMVSRRRAHAAALLGSTAESICRTAPCPVLVTHPEERVWVSAVSNRTSPGKVLVAHDFSDCSELALINALSLAQQYQSELHLIHVLHLLPGRGGFEVEPNAESAFQQAARRLDNSIPTEARAWCEPKVAVREGQPYREILSYAEEDKIDLICMGVRGTGFGMKALFGSNADRVLRQAPCPVLIARPLKPAQARSAEPIGNDKATKQ